MKTSIIVFPGTNREKDMAMAIKTATGKDPTLVWHQETSLTDTDLIILPGGFSYGDYLRCGAMAAHSPVMKEVIRMAGNGTRVLGVCNGFQMLIETKLLPGALLHNKSLKFICKQIHLRCESSGDVIRVPIAHGEGNFFVNDNQLQQLEDTSSIAFRYCDKEGQISDDANPNGSIANIAGIYNKNKTILGMMPHPENATQSWQDNQTGLKTLQTILEKMA